MTKRFKSLREMHRHNDKDEIVTYEGTPVFMITSN